MLKLIRRIALLSVVLLLSGCKMALLNPKGIIAASEKSLLVDSTLLMLVVVIPVIIMSFVFAWHFRSKNKKASYKPEWHHSTALEAVCWIIPCIIIGILGVMTWVSTHKLDPYRPLASAKKTLVIQVVALDWKWLFIYPKQGISTVNFVEIPVNVPVRFEITADAPMNSFQIPQLAGQIYAMPGMRTKLNLEATSKGSYKGFSANFSGDGFSAMNFIVKVSSKKAFHKWVQKAQRATKHLTISAYDRLVQPSENVPVTYYADTTKYLFKDIITKYTKPNSILVEATKGKRHVSITR